MAKKEKPKRNKRYVPKRKEAAKQIGNLFPNATPSAQEELVKMADKMFMGEQERLQREFMRDMNIPEGDEPRFQHLIDTFDEYLGSNKEFFALISMARHPKLQEFMTIQEIMDLGSLANLLNEDWEFIQTQMSELRERVLAQMAEVGITPETKFDMGDFGHYAFWESVIEAHTNFELIVNSTFVVDSTYLYTLVSMALSRANEQGIVFNIEDFQDIDPELVERFAGKHLMSPKEEPKEEVATEQVAAVNEEQTETESKPSESVGESVEAVKADGEEG